MHNLRQFIQAILNQTNETGTYVESLAITATRNYLLKMYSYSGPSRYLFLIRNAEILIAIYLLQLLYEG